MLFQNATDVRKDWGRAIDTVVRVKPLFVKRARDYVCMINKDDIELILSNIAFSANEFIEDDGSVTLSLNEIDIVSHGKDHDEALDNLAADLEEYAQDYYSDFEYWFSGLNRKSHYPYIMRVLALDDREKLKGIITCRLGKS